MSDTESPTSGAGTDAAKKPTASTYYQWSSDKAKRQEELSKLGVDIRPKAVEGSSTPTLTPQTSVGSAWNSAGTWEERDVTSRALAHMKTGFTSFRHTTSSGLQLSITDVTQCEGSVTLVFSRGKAKPGFEVSVKVEWSLFKPEEADSAARGTFTIDEISDSEGSDMFSRLVADCNHSTAVDKASGKAAALEAREAIRALLRDWVEAVKAM